MCDAVAGSQLNTEAKVKDAAERGGSPCKSMTPHPGGAWKNWDGPWQAAGNRCGWASGAYTMTCEKPGSPGHRRICVCKGGSEGATYEKIMGWPNNASLLSAHTAPCNVAEFVSKLKSGDGYFSDPGVSGGLCRSISGANIAAVREQKRSGQWTNHRTGAVFFPYGRTPKVKFVSCSCAIANFILSLT